MYNQSILVFLRVVLRVVNGRRRDAEALYPIEIDDYHPPILDGSSGLSLKDIPIGHSMIGPQSKFPPPMLSDCREPLVDGAPDLRGVWKVYKGMMRGNVQRIEQAGDRVVISSGSIVHDMRADGVLAHGVHDVSFAGNEIRVMAEFRNDRLNLRPNGRMVMVTRYLDNDEMVWRYGPFRNRLRRLTGPPTTAV